MAKVAKGYALFFSLCIVAALSMLTACGSTVKTQDDGVDVYQPHYVEVNTPSGIIECIVGDDGYQAGISCNWDK